MCGIAGFIDPKGNVRDPAPCLNVLQGELLHRGPDDRGTWSSHNRVANFAHTRLSILDLSAAGHQPMSLADGRLTITFNGEIYNFRELRAELEQDGVTFRTATDTEVILRLYERHGTNVVDRLRGMFAFAIWDEREQSCFLARDPLGIKPLYYTHSNGVLAFASELRALQRAGFAGRAIDAQALAAYFETGTVPEPCTLLRDARCLEAAHWLLWKDGRLEKTCYWRIRFAPRHQDRVEAVRNLREALLDSVRRHFVSDVPVGIFLSGGIDSTALVALARQIGIRDISTFSIGVDDPALDESAPARRTARHFGTDHHEFVLSEEDGKSRFEQFLRHVDQPTIDGFNTFTVSSFAASKGLKVVLSGLGGDEMFGGYPSFAQVPRLVLAAKLLGLVPGLRHHLGVRLEHHSRSHRLRRLGVFLQGENTIPNAYHAFRGIFSRRAARILAARFAGVTLAEFLAHHPPEPAPDEGFPTSRDAVSFCELSRYMRNQLLKDSDVMSMAHGLELRVPYVDRDLFETAAAIPASLRLQQGKKILLSAVPEVPEWVANQPKRGFLFPYQKWATSTWGSLFRETTATLPVVNPTWYQQWCVFVLAQWLEQRGLAVQ